MTCLRGGKLAAVSSRDEESEVRTTKGMSEKESERVMVVVAMRASRSGTWAESAGGGGGTG